MAAFNVERDEQLNKQTIASWAYGSNITDHNERVMNDVSAEGAKFIKVSYGKNWKQILKITYCFYCNGIHKLNFNFKMYFYTVHVLKWKFIFKDIILY